MMGTKLLLTRLTDGSHGVAEKQNQKEGVGIRVLTREQQSRASPTDPPTLPTIPQPCRTHLIVHYTATELHPIYGAYVDTHTNVRP